jgi:hypothetical protein
VIRITLGPYNPSLIKRTLNPNRPESIVRKFQHCLCSGSCASGPLLIRLPMNQWPPLRGGHGAFPFLLSDVGPRPALARMVRYFLSCLGVSPLGAAIAVYPHPLRAGRLRHCRALFTPVLFVSLFGVNLAARFSPRGPSLYPRCGDGFWFSGFPSGALPFDKIEITPSDALCNYYFAFFQK